MFGGSESNLYPFDLDMEDRNIHKSCSKLLELAAADDLAGFVQEIEESGGDVNEARFWYGRSFRSKKMGFEERTPIMIASLYGSIDVLKYIIETCRADINKACGWDGATALHCAAAGGAVSCVEAVELLIGAGGDVDAVDAKGKKAGELIAPCVKSWKKKRLEVALNGVAPPPPPTAAAAAEVGEKKEYYPVDVSLPDINSGVYGSDEFRMYSFKVKPCSRAYSHDWTECPFAHPGENARRRDPRRCSYSCVPCPEFKKGSCGKGDACEYAHGVFESWLHPAQYRTRLCKDEIGCCRKVCFFAHKAEELRPLYAATGSAMPSPSSPLMTPSNSNSISPCSSPMWQGKASLSLTPPPALHLSGSRLKASLTARDLDFNGTNLDEFFGSLDLNSPTAVKIRQNIRSSYPSSCSTSSSQVRKPTAAAYGLESVMNSRASALSKRSQSFVGYRSASVSGSPSLMMSDWRSPDGKLEWGFNGAEDAGKLRKSTSFGFRGAASVEEHEMMMMMKNMPPPHWFDQMYIDQEQMVA